MRNLAANPTAMRNLKSLFLDNKGEVSNHKDVCGSGGQFVHSYPRHYAASH